MTLRILITGSREFKDTDAIAKALIKAIEDYGTHLLVNTGPHKVPTVLWDKITVVHGGARGADTIAGRIASAWGMDVEQHPADWRWHGRAAGPIRNSEMVQLGADVCLAFPLGRSPGTRNCMQLAEAAGIPVRSYEQATVS